MVSSASSPLSSSASESKTENECINAREYTNKQTKAQTPIRIYFSECEIQTCVNNITLQKGRGKAQPFRRRCLAAETRIHSHGHSCGICCGLSNTSVCTCQLSYRKFFMFINLTSGGWNKRLQFRRDIVLPTTHTHTFLLVLFHLI